MTADDCYVLMQFIINKNQQGYFDPDDFNTTINRAQDMYLAYLLGGAESYQPGRPVPRIQYGMNANIRQSISILIGPPSTVPIDGNGIGLYPSDFEQVDAMYTTAMNRIRWVPQNKLYSYLKSTIDPVATNPIYLIESDGFKFYPVTLGSALLSYVKTPPTIAWAFTLDGNGIPIYNAGTSFNPVWRDADMMLIISRALKMVGINLQDGAVSQYADQLKQTGQ